MNIRELAALTDVAERQIRFLIAEGFVPAPRGGRANADYGDDHASAIRRYMQLRNLGFPPAAIKLLLEGGPGVPFPVAPGITLVIAPDLLGGATDLDPLIAQLRSLLTELKEETAHDKNCTVSTHEP